MSISKNLAANLLIPTKRASNLSMPVGPDDDLVFVPLTTKTTGEITTPTSGKGVIVFYPSTCSRKIGEVWGDDGAGGLIFLRYVTESVDLSQNFTYGRVIKRTITIEQNQVLAGASGASASVQGILGGTVVQGGISQLYQAGITTADTFSIGNLSQLSGNPAYSLMSVKGSDGVGFNLPVVNRDFARIDDDAPGGDANDYAENIDTSRPNVTHLKWNYHNDLPATWGGSSTLSLESDSFSIDIPYHGILAYHLFLEFTQGATPIDFRMVLNADFYSLDRSTPVLTKQIFETRNIADVIPTMSGQFVFPGRTNEIHETYTAVKFRLSLIPDATGSLITFNTGSLLSNIHSPLYKGMGYTQKPLLIPFEGFSSDAPLLYHIMTNYELTPNTAQSKITQSSQRNINDKLYRKIDDAQNLFILSGGSFLWKSALPKGVLSAASYEKEISMILDYEFSSSHPEDIARDHNLTELEHGADFSFNFIHSLEKLGRNARKGLNTLYRHGGKEMISDALSAVPVAGSIAKAHLPAKFASGATFGATFATKNKTGASFMMTGRRMKDNYDEGYIVIKEQSQPQIKKETYFCKLDKEQQKYPMVFVPGIFGPEEGNRGLFVLMKSDLDILTNLNLTEQHNHSWTAKHPIYGHAGEKWNVPVPFPLVLAEVEELGANGIPTNIKFELPGTGRSLGLAVVAMQSVDRPLYLAFTGDAIRNQTIEQMNPIIIAKKLQSLPANMTLVTRCNITMNSRIINYQNTLSLTKDLKSLTREQKLLTPPIFMPNKTKKTTQPKTQPKSQPKKTSAFLEKPMNERDYLIETVRRANPLFFPSGKWQYDYNSLGDAFFRGDYYKKAIQIAYNHKLTPQTANAIILKCLYETGLIYHSGAGVKTSSSQPFIDQAQEALHNLNAYIKQIVPALAEDSKILYEISQTLSLGKAVQIESRGEGIGFTVIEN